ncbi:MAG: hypothetical protein H0U49_05000 [Parachlamydiaceae bacterium]|nr:hypothetical protein [Parachlamydiaceae bacterium]
MNSLYAHNNLQWENIAKEAAEVTRLGKLISPNMTWIVNKLSQGKFLIAMSGVSRNVSTFAQKVAYFISHGKSAGNDAQILQAIQDKTQLLKVALIPIYHKNKFELSQSKLLDQAITETRHALGYLDSINPILKEDIKQLEQLKVVDSISMATQKVFKSDPQFNTIGSFSNYYYEKLMNASFNEDTSTPVNEWIYDFLYCAEDGTAEDFQEFTNTLLEEKLAPLHQTRELFGNRLALLSSASTLLNHLKFHLRSQVLGKKDLARMSSDIKSKLELIDQVAVKLYTNWKGGFDPFRVDIPNHYHVDSEPFSSKSLRGEILFKYKEGKSRVNNARWYERYAHTVVGLLGIASLASASVDLLTRVNLLKIPIQPTKPQLTTPVQNASKQSQDTLVDPALENLLPQCPINRTTPFSSPSLNNNVPTIHTPFTRPASAVYLRSTLTEPQNNTPANATTGNCSISPLNSLTPHPFHGMTQESQLTPNMALFGTSLAFVITGIADLVLSAFDQHNENELSKNQKPAFGKELDIFGEFLNSESINKETDIDFDQLFDDCNDVSLSSIKNNSPINLNQFFDCGNERPNIDAVKRQAEFTFENLLKRRNDKANLDLNIDNGNDFDFYNPGNHRPEKDFESVDFEYFFKSDSDKSKINSESEQKANNKTPHNDIPVQIIKNPPLDCSDAIKNKRNIELDIIEKPKIKVTNLNTVILRRNGKEEKRQIELKKASEAGLKDNNEKIIFTPKVHNEEKTREEQLKTLNDEAKTSFYDGKTLEVLEILYRIQQEREQASAKKLSVAENTIEIAANSFNLINNKPTNLENPLKNYSNLQPEQNLLDQSSTLYRQQMHGNDAEKLLEYSLKVSNFSGDQSDFDKLEKKIFNLAMHTSGILISDERFKQSILLEESKQSESLSASSMFSDWVQTSGNRAPETLLDSLHSKNFKKVLLKIKAGYQAGILPDQNKGACNSLKLKDDQGKFVGIFKLLTPESLTLQRRLEINLKLLFGVKRPTDYLPGAMPEAKGYAEKLAYDLDRMLGFGLIPETNFMCSSAFSQDCKIGTLQVFVDEYKEAAEIFNDPVHKNDPNEDELDLMQKFIIEDVLMGNLDRKSDNWMVKLDENGRLKDIAVIDNGNSFIFQNPGKNDTYILANQYMWAEHPYSRYAFTQKSIDLVTDLEETKILKFFEIKKVELADFPEASRFFVDDMVKKTMERIYVLKNVVKDANSPQDLAKIKTAEDFSRFNIYST